MASVEKRVAKKSGEVSYYVRWRQPATADQPARARSLAFVDAESAEAFRINVERLGTDAAMRILGLVDAGIVRQTLTQWCEAHIETLTGVEEATRQRYRSYVRNDIAPTIGAMPLATVTDTTIARWVNDLAATGASGKTVANKHGFLAGALNHAVRAGKIAANPCDHTRLPRTDNDEMVFLTRDEFTLLCGAMTERWQPLTRWLVATGTRFGEATALTVGDINAVEETARINKAWKYTGSNGARRLAHTKTRKGTRTINIASAILAELDLDRDPDQLLFPTRDGGPISNQLYKNKAWLPALRTVTAPDADPRLSKRPRIHDLRHTCASWMIAAGIPLPVIQQHMGHESITTTVHTYGHLDRTSGKAAAAAIGAMLD
ncbi:tyrosine integrase [Gordonia phage Howe]|uniref:Integrase n=1 Tax=Gordonia phage Howe TaxID=1777061 RepID=A0A0U4IH55_9CAUD|nr:integrase [Gordonia phage Howe]AZF93225.1 tyrosine integrase [Gordonia phage Adora]QDF16820.1 tyrosine integrase [Gordonia phage Twinkle]QYC54439.1 tyrosine integrase [Gordonia phage Shlim410]UAJ16289.1 tyrosine integrase [Gordonia phage Hortense]ALY07674.1 tyrosine integrase [Gordonia phage Howe]